MQHTRKRYSNFSHDKAKGFTLIEVLVSITLLSIGLLGLASLQGQAFRATGMSQGSTMGNNLARNTIERILGNPGNVSAYDAMNTATGSRPNCPTLSPPLVCAQDFTDWQNTVSSLPQGVLQVSTTTGANFDTVTVTVSWQDAKGNHSVILPVQVGL